MKNLERPIVVKVYLNADEKKLLDLKVKESEMVSTTAFIRHLITYGFVYTVPPKRHPLPGCLFFYGYTIINSYSRLASDNSF